MIPRNPIEQLERDGRDRNKYGQWALEAGLACWLLPLIFSQTRGLSLCMALLAILFGAVGTNVPQNRGMAIAGLVLGGLYVFLFILGLRIFLAFIGTFGGT